MSLSLNPGDRLAGKYVVERLLGEGGMGSVYAAHDEQLHRHVAIKVLNEDYSKDAEGRELALREARAVARLRSEHVARVLDAGVADGDQPFIVMEHLQGADLRERLAAGPVPVADAVGFIVQACEAIAEAHAAGITHRDLKPDNLFVTEGVDGLPQVKVLDFGIAKRLSNDADLTGSGGGASRYIGSPPYIAPERLRDPRQIDKRSDIWALGVVLYESLAGSRPFHGDAVPDLVIAILEREPAPLRSLRPEVSESLARVVHDCLHKDPESRIQSAGRLAEALLPFAAPWALPAGYRTMHLDSLANTERAVAVAERVAALTGAGPPGGERVSSATRAIVPRRVLVSRRNRWLAVGALAGAVLVALIFLLAGRGTDSRLPTRPGTPVISPAAKPVEPMPASHAEAAPANPMNTADRTERPYRPAKPHVRPGAARAAAPAPVLPVDPLEGRK